jgi:hypothetical protein
MWLRDKWQAHVDTVVDHQVPYMWGIELGEQLTAFKEFFFFFFMEVSGLFLVVN